MKRFVVGACVLVGCSQIERSQLDRLQAEPSLRETVVLTSAPRAPDWAEPRQQRQTDGVVFVGEGSATDVAGARAVARKNLFSTISNFITVDVSSELVDFASSDGTNNVRLTVQTKSDTTIEGVAPDGAYWEQILVSPILQGEERYRFLMRAFVPREEISRARTRAQAVRLQNTGQPSLVVLPFDLALGDEPTLAPALWEELTSRLADAGAWRVAEPDLVRSVYAGDGDRRAAQARVQDALLPDMLVSGTAQIDADRIRVTLTVRDGRDGRALSSDVATASVAATSQMVRRLARHLRDSHGAKDKPTRTEPLIVPIDALRYFAEAYEHYARGELDEATASVKKGIELAPDDPRGWMRLGRILERRGHFGRLLPRAAGGSPVDPLQVRACTDEGRVAIVEARQRIETRAAAYRTNTTEARVWWNDATADIDGMLASASAVLLSKTGAGPCGTCADGLVCDPLSTVCLRPCTDLNWCSAEESCGSDGVCTGGRTLRGTNDVDSAAEAYFMAMSRSNAAGNIRREVQAGLALADLAVRVDRFDEAEQTYAKIASWAAARRDLHVLSLATYGRGVLQRQRGRFGSARVYLLDALRVRASLGEKPYLLEIYNELGAVSVELGRVDDAKRFFGRALTIAEDLGQPYVKAILDNNVGVLEVAGGEVSLSRARFERALSTLTDLGDSEGRLSAALNLGFVASLRGDPIEAETRLSDAEKLVEQSGQEGRRSQWLAQRGASQVLGGQASKALVDIAESGLVSGRLGRMVEAQRRISDFVVAEQHAETPTEEIIECHARLFAAMGTPVFEARSSDQQVQTIDQIPLGSMQVHDLVAAMNAAVIAAQTSWRPEIVRYPTPAAQAAIPHRPQTTFELLRRIHQTLASLPEGTPTAPRVYGGPPSAPVIRDQVLQAVRRARELYLERPTGSSDEMAVLLDEATRWQKRPMRVPDPDRRVVLEAQPAPPENVIEAIISTGSAATKRERPATPAATFDKPPEYERLLGAAAVSPDLVLLLDPEALSANRPFRSRLRNARRMLASVAEHFTHLKLARYEASARLNLGAVLWFEWRPEEAYEQLMAARTIFARMGDAEGLARTYEWLGYVLKDSREPERAARHLALARHLYERQDDATSVARVLSYFEAE